MIYFRHMRGGPNESGRSVSLRSAMRLLYEAAKLRRGASSHGSGFTVIEVVIVLAITGALFVSAAVMISGRQNQTAFDQAVQQIHSQVQQVLNEVSTGFYPNNANFQCTALVAGSPPTLSPGSANQGTNSGCIFLGKAMQFKLAGSDPEQFAVYTIAGLKDFGTCTAGTNAEADCLAAAMPMTVAPSNSSEVSSGYPDLSVNETLQYGLRAVRMWYNNGGTDQEIGAVAFVNSLTRQSTGSVLSGTGQVNMIALDGSSLDASKLDIVELMDSNGGDGVAGGTINPSGGIFICFESGGTNDWGIIKIGGENRELAVSLIIKDKGTGTCTAS